MRWIVFIVGLALGPHAAWSADPTGDLTALADSVDRAVAGLTYPDRCFDDGFMQVQAYFARKAKAEWGTPAGKLDLDWLAATWPTIEAELNANRSWMAHKECDSGNNYDELGKLISEVEDSAAGEAADHPAEEYPMLTVSSVTASVGRQLLTEVRSLVSGDAAAVGFLDKNYLPALDWLANKAEKDDIYLPDGTYRAALELVNLLFVSEHTKYVYVGYPALATGSDVVKRKLKLFCSVVDVYKRYLAIDSSVLDADNANNAEYVEMERRKTTCDDYISSWP